MRLLLPALLSLLLLMAPVAAAAPVTYFVHGSAALADNRAPAAVALTMDLMPGTQAQPRIVLAHSGGDTIAANPVTASFTATEPLLIGDGDPATQDVMTANVCMSQTTQSAFVTRMLVTVLVDGTRVARRLSNDFSIPANVPSCKAIAVTIGMFVDSQTAANTAPLEGVVLDGAGNLVVPAGGKVTYLVDVDTALGGPIWGYYYDSPTYPASLTFDVAPATTAAATVYSNLTGPGLNESFPTATNGTYVYNFTVAQAPAAFSYNVTGTGNVTVVVRDANGTAVVNQTLLAPTAGNEILAEAVAGNWSYAVTLQAFNGTLRFDFPAESSGTGTSGTSTSRSATPTASATRSSTSNATGNATADPEAKDTPVFGPPALVLAILAVAVVLRRRR